jgi:UDP-N-acetylglucosamine 1-carboxyvinyltransferase
MNDDRIIIRRSGPLFGEITIPGAKNSVLKLMAASLLADGEYVVTNVPGIVDVGTMADLLVVMGVETTFGPAGTITMVNNGDLTPVAPYELVEKLRASINVLGPLLGRCGYVKLSMPGGDDFGSRPIDMHLKGLEAMGATFEMRHGYIEGRADRLHGANITLEFPSVGATENILTAAVHAKGTTVIDNAAREPEIADLCNMLVTMGADLEGIGTSTLVVHGVEPGTLSAASHAVVADRLQAATYIAATAICGGEVVLRGARREHMEMFIRRLADMGVTVSDLGDGLAVWAQGRMRSIDIATLPYPGIATDYKPILVAMLCFADGVSIVTENLYPGRFRYIEELVRLGADIRTDGHHAVIRGSTSLSGAQTRAVDIRAGASLVLVGLGAEGETIVSGVDHIDRGYDDLVGRLRSLGADIERVSGGNW